MKPPPKVVELPATPELLARVDLSHNGNDMLCARGGLFGPRCQEPPVTVFLSGGFLWPGCQEDRDQLGWALSIMPADLSAPLSPGFAKPKLPTSTTSRLRTTTHPRN